MRGRGIVKARKKALYSHFKWIYIYIYIYIYMYIYIYSIRIIKSLKKSIVLIDAVNKTVRHEKNL